MSAQYFTAKLIAESTSSLRAGTRMVLEAAFVRELEGVACGPEALRAMCVAAGQDRATGERLKALVLQAEARLWLKCPRPSGARFSLTLWTVADL